MQHAALGREIASLVNVLLASMGTARRAMMLMNAETTHLFVETMPFATISRGLSDVNASQAISLQKTVEPALLFTVLKIPARLELTTVIHRIVAVAFSSEGRTTRVSV